MDVGLFAEIADLSGSDRCLDPEVAGDILEERQHDRHLPLGQQIDLQIQMRSLVRLLGEAALTREHKEQRKMASKDTMVVRRTNGNGSKGRTPGTNPVFAASQNPNHNT